MLLNDFFFIDSLDQDGNSARVAISFDKKHVIFDGHFPGRPVVPGACLLQMVEEVITTIVARTCRLSHGEQIKFIVPIDPNIATGIGMAFTWQETADRQLSVFADLSAGAVTCFKFKGIFRSA